MSAPPPSENGAEDIIVCRDVHKWFGSFEALRGVDMTVRTGEVVVIIGGDREDALFPPALALDLLGIPAAAAVTVGMPSHATPPFVSIAQSRIAMASASLSSAGLKPRAVTAATMAALSALPLPAA